MQLEDYIEDSSWTCIEAATIEKPEYIQLMLKSQHDALRTTIVFAAKLSKAQAKAVGLQLAAWGTSPQD